MILVYHSHWPNCKWWYVDLKCNGTAGFHGGRALDGTHWHALVINKSLFYSPRQSQAMWIYLSRAGSPLLITPIRDVRNHRKRQKCFWRNLTMCIREHKEHPGAIVVKRHVYVSWFLFVTRCACLHCLGWKRHPGAIVVIRQIRQLVACWHARYPSPGSPSFWQSLLRHPH